MELKSSGNSDAWHDSVIE